jgi:membrane fusion protein (multidrug efflux system)
MINLPARFFPQKALVPYPFTRQAKKTIMKIRISVLIFCSMLTLLACQKKQEAPPEAPPTEVQVFETEAQDVPIFQEFVGQIYGAEDIAIRARVEGFLEEMHFDEGSEVEKGTLLYVLESQPFEADVAAKMSQVAEAKTVLAKTTSDLNRIRPLARKRAVSQSDLDGAVAAYEASKASVEAAEANLRAANIQLSYTKIHAPITGLIGKTQAKVGDFVGRSPNPVILNVVSNIDTVRVDFFLTESQFLAIARRYLVEGDDADQEETPEAELELILADGSVYPHKGKPDFVDRGIDPTTGAILVQASFPNPDKLLRPGLFARIRTQVDVAKDGILVPQRCVTELQGLFRVFVVGDQNKIEERQVTMGPTIDNFWLVKDGLKPGEKVVYEGLQKIGDGATVNPVVTDVKQITPNGQ